ncbi:MAG: acetate--CoA ligase family protein, partial [Candidatus Krumholzibacteria bacterium]|nr:acetate--CoA ligase family protein [Candidatus Krumholzibacteria bacterium]
MNTIPDAVSRILAAARDEGRTTLLETEGLDLVEALGLDAPRRVQVRDAVEVTADTLAPLPGERVVVKVVSEEILHKTDVGGIAVVAREAGAVSAAIADMAQRLGDRRLAGFLVEELIAYDRAPGRELLLGLRWTDDFGPIIVVGAGGVHTEFLSANLLPGRNVAVLSPLVEPVGGAERVLRRAAAVEMATEEQRGQEPLVDLERVVEAVSRVGALAPLVPAEIREFEMNPLVAHDGRLVALDVLVRLGDGTAPELTSRPLDKLVHLLEPRSIAVMGVSKSMNPGRVILQNLIREGFPREHIRVVKPIQGDIEGCQCVGDIASLPERVAMLVL